MAKSRQVSSLILDEAFAKQDDQFLDLLRSFHEPKKLASLADRWSRDPRPWAREQLYRYLDELWTGPAHKPVVKHLFKSAEAQRDDGVVGLCMVAFDRSVRRQRRKKTHWEWRTGESWTEEQLHTPIDSLFSNRTNYYLRRRAWRYFRRMGFQKPAQYVPVIAPALAHYEDTDLAKGENILDSWGLIHACFGKSEVIEFTPSLVRIRDGQRMRDLKAAPYFPKLWQAKEAASVLLNLVATAKARLVRVWAIELLRRWHGASLDQLPVERILALLDHPSAEVQQFGAGIFSNSKALGTLPLETWLRLLGTKNLDALDLIIAAMEKHVAGERLSLSQLVEMACARPVPVVRLSLRFLAARPAPGANDLATIARLSEAKCEGAGGEIARWALGILGTQQNYDADRVVRFFDSPLRSMRGASWDWLTPTSAGWNDTALWSRLIESPYDDVRLRLVAALQKRAGAPGVGISGHAGLWCSVLLGIHRGGRVKLGALNQVSRALVEHPEDAEQLLPVLAVAIRSVRLPEARSGLAAVVSAVDARPELEALAGRFLPELKLRVEAGAA